MVLFVRPTRKLPSLDGGVAGSIAYGPSLDLTLPIDEELPVARPVRRSAIDHDGGSLVVAVVEVNLAEPLVLHRWGRPVHLRAGARPLLGHRRLASQTQAHGSGTQDLRRRPWSRRVGAPGLLGALLLLHAQLRLLPDAHELLDLCRERLLDEAPSGRIPDPVDRHGLARWPLGGLDIARLDRGLVRRPPRPPAEDVARAEHHGGGGVEAPGPQALRRCPARVGNLRPAQP
mmetsp:Transcript_33341/g.94899  ORF Transcript_33341/g.94899 Transcript_33341/m.94899 type:complete len:231 (+) Transcript_33341:1112-1804(+)